MAMLLPINLAATWFMTGLIWFVQMVHYPQFAGVGADSFVPYHRRHQRFTTYVVGGPMIVEAITAVLLVVAQPHSILLWTALALAVAIWLSTALLQVPRHFELARGFDDRSCQRLCGTNWLRTIAWTARAVIMLYAATIALGRA